MAIAISFVIYLLLENWRSGINTSVFDIRIKEAIDHFFDSEFNYPKHYDYAATLAEQKVYNSSVFWLWLITLPIPKAIINVPFVDSYTSIIYRVYTYYYWGGHWGREAGYSGQLLSVMGDGIFVFGERFAFIIIIPFGLFIGFFLSYLLKIGNSEVIYSWSLFYFFVSFRPGVQYALQYVNTFVGMCLIIICLKYLSGEYSHKKQFDLKKKEG